MNIRNGSVSSSTAQNPANMARLKEFGAWSEQTSSSGKRYYYNRDTEVSQWEKPTEWKEHEKSLMEKYKLLKGPSKTSSSKPIASSLKSTAGGDSNSSHVPLSNANTSSSSANKHHNSSSSSMRVASSSANNVSSSSQQSSTQKSRQSDSLKRPRDDDRHHHHSSSNSRNNTSTADPFLAPQSTTTGGNVERSGGSGTRGGGGGAGDRSDKFSSSNGEKRRKTSLELRLEKMFKGSSKITPVRPSVVSSGGDSNTPSANQMFSNSTSSSKYHNSSFTNLRPLAAVGSANSVLASPQSSSSQQKSRTSESLKRPREDDRHYGAQQHTSNKVICLDTSATSTVVAPPQQQPSSNVVNERTTVEKPPEQPPIFLHAPPVFNEAKYSSLYRLDLTGHRRNWSSQAYMGEARRCAERSAKQTTTLNAVDDDVRSVRSLIGAAELRCSLLNQKLTFIRGQITNLEAKNPSL